MKIKREELVKIFKELVYIYSPTRKEKEVADYLIKFLKNLGAETYLDNSFDKYNGNAPTIFAKFKGNIEGEGITFSAHMDVVEPNKGVKIIEEDEIIKTDGNTTLGGDDKAGIAVILYAVKYIIENNINHEDIYIIFTPGEEKGMIGAKNINWPKVYENMNPSKNIIVLDNAGKSKYVAYKAPTSSSFKISAIGKNAHAGIEPEKGISAIKILSEIISEMEIGRIDNSSTANICEIKSDFPINVVPDYAYCFGEVRSHTKERLNEILTSYENISKEVSGKYGGKYNMEVEELYPPLDTKDNLKFAKEFIEVYKKIGVDASLQVIGGGSDANFFAEEGFNSIIIGMGMEKVHTKNEYLDIKEFIIATEVVIEYLKK